MDWCWRSVRGIPYRRARQTGPTGSGPSDGVESYLQSFNRKFYDISIHSRVNVRHIPQRC